MASTFFTPAFFAFLKDLKAHNDRAWFAANKARFVDDVETPMREFIEAFGGRLREISPAFVVDPRRIGGSMFRIYRDTRFSGDKSPFKTWMAARFRHRGPGEAGLPGFYLHLAPDECYGGGGIYHTDARVVTQNRQHIVSSPRAWQAVRTSADVQGDRLSACRPATIRRIGSLRI
jgi:uncharacterized protein (TIGR02453 family)